MKKIIFSVMAAMILIPAAVNASPMGSSADPFTVIETMPLTNRTTSQIALGVVASTGSVSAVTVSSTVITRVDTAFAAAALSALSFTFKQAEITLQNNDTTDKFCGYSSTGLTIANSFKITVGAVWTFKVGRNMPIYCLNAAGASGTLIVGGLAWR